MNIANIYRSIRQILSNANIELNNKGLNKVNTLSGISIEIEKLGEINRLPYLIRKNIIEIGEEEFGDKIKDYAFINCDSLTSVTIGKGVAEIGHSAFYGCDSLTNITIPNSVTNIDSYAFFGCNSLTSITIPDSVTRIGSVAFGSCRNMATIYCNAIKPPIIDDHAMGHYTITIHVPIGSGDAYKSATNWSTYADIIVEDIIVE